MTGSDILSLVEVQRRQPESEVCDIIEFQCHIIEFQLTGLSLLKPHTEDMKQYF